MIQDPARADVQSEHYETELGGDLPVGVAHSGETENFEFNVSNVLDFDVACYSRYANLFNADTNRHEFVRCNLNMQEPSRFVLTLTVDL
jgi:hypothetical protein